VRKEYRSRKSKIEREEESEKFVIENFPEKSQDVGGERERETRLLG